MPLLLQHQTDALRWEVWKTEESPDDLLALLPPQTRIRTLEEIQSVKLPGRKMERIASRVLLCRLTGGEVFVRYDVAGKPFLSGRSGEYISISHAGDYVAAAWSRQPIGIDIERHRSRVCGVASRFLHPEEEVRPYGGDEVWGLLLHWSGKEAVYKCQTNPDADLRTLRARPFDPQPQGSFRMESSSSGEVFDVDYRFEADFVMAWAIRALI